MGTKATWKLSQSICPKLVSGAAEVECPSATEGLVEKPDERVCSSKVVEEVEKKKLPERRFASTSSSESLVSSSSFSSAPNQCAWSPVP